MNRKERQEARAERYYRMAENAQKRANEAFDASSKAVDGIPFGQPILTDHYSAKAHRSAIARSQSAMDRSVRESEKASYYQQKAEAAENNDNIYIGDDDAIDRLKEKIERLTRQQEQMKTDNKIVRSKSMPVEEKVKKLVENGHKEDYARKMIAEKIEWPSYALTNNNAKISAAKKQLEKAESLAGMEDAEYSIGDINVAEVFSENRIRLYFPGKPEDEMRNKLKHNGFRWAPSMGCWQAYINRWTLRFVKELNNTSL